MTSSTTTTSAPVQLPGWIRKPLKFAAIAVAIVFLVVIATVIAHVTWTSFGSSQQPARPPAQQTSVGPTNGPASAPSAVSNARCSLPGEVFVPQVGGCVQHVTNVAQIQAVSPDQANDPRCFGKPPGFHYDTNVIGPDGRHGVAHHTCGLRQR